MTLPELIHRIRKLSLITLGLLLLQNSSFASWQELMIMELNNDET